MQNIQDKAFDQLFKDQFEKAEIQPSTDLWNNIAAELKPATKLRFPVYWVAAALVLAVFGLGLLMPATEKVRLQAPVKLVALIDTATLSSPFNISQVDDTAQVTTYKSIPLVIAPRLDPDLENSIALKTMQPKQSSDRLIHKQDKLIKEADELHKASTAIADEPMIADAHVQENDIVDILGSKTEEIPHKGIRNVGDLINFVVNKVDKREKKVIQFDTDEDNSSIVALNIGFIKFNRKSDK
ncbi:hypothetical protein [Pedobacter heparinus]|uniref:hypothetical protein n=1 Tax=Pedobacter heparinus TaxID=984 RepID=UPI002930C7B3|nr:hypothetical protein [Pedobacter heparinus]